MIFLFVIFCGALIICASVGAVKIIERYNEICDREEIEFEKRMARRIAQELRLQK